MGFFGNADFSIVPAPEPVSGLTTVADVKTFWPDVVTFFSDSVIDSQLAIYILRATALINLIGNFDQTHVLWAGNSNLAAKLIVKRLILMDSHPAADAEPAGVVSEAARGTSYTRDKTPRTIRSLVGDEAFVLLEAVTTGYDATMFDTEIVFAGPNDLRPYDWVWGGGIRSLYGRIQDPGPTFEDVWTAAGGRDEHALARQRLFGGTRRYRG